MSIAQSFLSQFAVNTLLTLGSVLISIQWLGHTWTAKRLLFFIVALTSTYTIGNMVYYAHVTPDNYMWLAMMRTGVNHLADIFLISLMVEMTVWERLIFFGGSKIGGILGDLFFLSIAGFPMFHNIMTEYTIVPTLFISLVNLTTIYLFGAVLKQFRNRASLVSRLWPTVTAIAAVIMLAALVASEVQMSTIFPHQYNLFPGDHFLAFALMLSSTLFVLGYLWNDNKLRQADVHTYVQYQHIIERQYQASRDSRAHFNHYLTSLRNLLTQGSYESMGEVLLQWNEEQTTHFDDEFMKQIASIPDAGLRNLFRAKTWWARSQHIRVRYAFSPDAHCTPMRVADFSDLMAILLDNAIEAAAESEAKTLSMTWISAEEGCQLVIENSCDSAATLAMIFSEGFTTKPNHSGLGMTLFTRIMHRYEEVFYKVDYQNNTFRVALDFPPDA